MEWIIGIYLVVGVFIALSVVCQETNEKKPLWMYTKKNSFVWSFYFLMYVLTWPFGRR
jgi:hypothetical protein